LTAYVVVAVWGVGGFVFHVAVRGVAVWVALLVSAGLAGLALLVMFLVPTIHRRAAPSPPPPSTPELDPSTADALQLLDFASRRSIRVRRWAGAGIEDNARVHAEQARDAIGEIHILMRDAYERGRLAGGVLDRTRVIMQEIRNETNEKPLKAADWFDLKNQLHAERVRMLEAVNAADTQSGER
jgi:hypothetical protein